MNNKRWLVLVASICMGMCAQMVHAKKGFDYSYGEFGFAGTDADTFDGIGFGAGISYAAMDFVHVKMAYTRLYLDVDDDPLTTDIENKVEIDAFQIGLGGNYSITDKIDVLATISYFDQEFTKDIKDDADGYMVEAGVRTQPAKKFELDASVIQMETGGGGSDTGFSVGAVIDMHKKFSLSAKATAFDNDADEVNYFVGVRMEF